MGRDAYHPTNQTQRITVEVDVLTGAYTESVAEALLRTVVHEMLDIGTEITAVRVEIKGQMAAW